MNKIAALLLVLIFLSASCTIIAKPALSSEETTENSWTTKAPMHEARSGLGVAVVNNKIYAIGGVISSAFVPSSPGSAVYAGVTPVTVTGTNEEYDPTTDTWVIKTGMPTPRAVFAIAVYQNKIYCIGGKTNDDYTAVNEIYDPATNTWETKASSPSARAFLRSNVVNGKIYLIGGIPNVSLNEVYDPETDLWTTKASSPSPTIFGFSTAASTVLNSKIYFIGGLSADQHSNLNQIYDATTDSWSYGTSPPSSVDGGAAGATTGEMAPKRIYVIGNPANLKQGEQQTYVRAYNPLNDSWTFGADIITRRYNLAVAVVNDKLYVIGGHTYFWLEGTYTPVAVNEMYTPLSYGNPVEEPPVDSTAPEIAILSPESKSYAAIYNPFITVSLTFRTSESLSWVGYSLDGGNNITVTNETLIEIPAESRSLTLYANDTAGNWATPQTVYYEIAFNFDTAPPEPFPTTLVITASGVSLAVVAAGVLVYWKKRKR